MKLDRSILGVAVVAVSIVCGCSGAAPPPAAAPCSPPSEVATTHLTSADTLLSRAPKVGKVHLISDDEVGGGTDATGVDELTSPKEPRRATTHRRGGSFGVSK